MSNNSNSAARTREHLANERTFLAWIRTSISLIGLGFVIVKFTIFLKQVSKVIESDELDLDSFLSNEFSSVIGVLMIAIGIALSIFAYIQLKKNENQINNNDYSSSTFLSLMITLIILIGGIILISYLINFT